MSVKLFSTSKSEYLARKISKYYGKDIARSELKIFSDGEFCHSLKENVRGEKVFIISSLYSLSNRINDLLELVKDEEKQKAMDILKDIVSSSDSVFELLQMIDAAKRASAKDIVAVIPYFGWARQDRKDRARVPITAKLLSNIIVSAGATRIVTIDLHAEQIQGFFDIPVDSLKSSFVFYPYIEQLSLGKRLVIGSPDEGGGKRAKPYSDHFNSRMIFMYKDRSEANKIGKMELIGNVNGKDVIFIDDIVDTAGTIATAANILVRDRGARSVRACVTHPVLSGDAYSKIDDSELTELIVTDTIPINKDRSDKIKVLSVADMIARAIVKINTNESISYLFNNI